MRLWHTEMQSSKAQFLNCEVEVTSTPSLSGVREDTMAVHEVAHEWSQGWSLLQLCLRPDPGVQGPWFQTQEERSGHVGDHPSHPDYQPLLNVLPKRAVKEEG